MQTLLESIEKYLARTGMPPSGFGRTVAGDGHFVFDLRAGRIPKETTILAVREWMKAHPAPRTRKTTPKMKGT